MMLNHSNNLTPLIINHGPVANGISAEDYDDIAPFVYQRC